MIIADCNLGWWAWLIPPAAFIVFLALVFLVSAIEYRDMYGHWR